MYNIKYTVYKKRIKRMRIFIVERFSYCELCFYRQNEVLETKLIQIFFWLYTKVASNFDNSANNPALFRLACMLKYLLGVSSKNSVQ